MTFDIFLLILLLIFLFEGIRKGAIAMVFRFCSFLLSIFLVPIIRPFIEIIISKEKNILVYIISFVTIYILLNILVYFIEKFIDAIHLGGVNKFVGGIIGTITAFSIGYLVMVIMICIPNSKRINSIINESYSIYYISIYTKSFNKYFPEFVENRLDELNSKNQNIRLQKEIYKDIKKGVNINED